MLTIPEPTVMDVNTNPTIAKFPIVPSGQSSFASATGTFIRRRARIGMSRRPLRPSRREFIFEVPIRVVVVMVTLSIRFWLLHRVIEDHNCSS